MKKLSFILGVLVVIAFSSCSKEKECKCVTHYEGVSMDDVTTTMTIDEGDCDDGNSTTTTAGVTVTMTCTEQ